MQKESLLKFLSYPCFILSILFSGCELTKRKNRRTAPTNNSQIIVSRQDPVTATRDTSSEFLIFNFTATDPFKCNAEIWNKNPDQEPFKDKPLKIECNQGEKKGPGLVQVQLGPVDPNIRYQVKMQLFSDTGKVDQITLVENDEGPTTIQPAPTGAHTSFLVRTSLATSQSLITAFRGNKKKEFSKPNYTGCRINPFPTTNQTGKSRSPILTLVKSSGFAAAEGEPVVGSGSSLALNYTRNLQYGTDWAWTYSIEGDEETFEVPAPNQLTLFKVSQGKDLFIGKPQLRGDQLLALPFRKTIPLTVTWESANSSVASRVEVWMGSNNLNQGIVCHQSISQKSVIIPSQLLLQLPNGAHQILIFLYSEVQFESKVIANTIWNFKSADWRFGTLSLQ